jgi:hypothetical protein
LPRSAYYTLLKWDVLQSGKFAIDLEKCVNLAAYQLQIEVPDNKPTLPYLKMLNLLPQVPFRPSHRHFPSLPSELVPRSQGQQ